MLFVISTLVVVVCVAFMGGDEDIYYPFEDYFELSEYDELKY